MRFTSLLWRFYAGFVVLIVVTAVIIATLASSRLESESWSELTRGLHDKAVQLRALATPVLRSNDVTGFQDRIRSLRDELSPNVRLSVFMADGTVVGDSHMDPSRMESHADREEFREAVSDGQGESDRYSTTLKLDMVYVALAVRQPGGGLEVGEKRQLLGVVRAAVPRAVIDQRLSALRESVFFGSLLAAGVALVLAFVLARLFTAPIIDLARAATSIADGDYARRVRLRRNDELGLLADSFNSMADELQARIQNVTNEHAKLRAILGGMSEGVVAIDASERVLHLNRVAARIMDAPLDSSVGQRIWELTRVSELCQALTRTLEEGVAASVEVTIHRTGRDVRLDIHTTPLVDASGDRIGAVAVIQDLTTLRQLEVMRTDFVTNVSHELKTPITAIQGLADTMAGDDEMPAETRNRFLTRITAQSRLLASLVTDLLTLARLESEESMLEIAPFDLNAPARTVLERTQAMADEKGVKLLLTPSEVPCPVVGDEELLRVAINNLVENAIKYNPEGTTVEIRVLFTDGTGVIEVQDDGVGIESIQQERIFERFYRVDKARSRELGGTGLGLAIVKHICRTHGGDVDLDSQVGAGARFTLRIPLEAARSPS